eukprot:gene5452-biopygen2788
MLEDEGDAAWPPGDRHVSTKSPPNHRRIAAESPPKDYQTMSLQVAGGGADPRPPPNDGVDGAEAPLVPLPPEADEVPGGESGRRARAPGRGVGHAAGRVRVGAWGHGRRPRLCGELDGGAGGIAAALAAHHSSCRT